MVSRITVALLSFAAFLAWAPAAAPTSLEIGWISREPRLRAPATLTGPKTDGWPAAGSAVQWIGHVINRGTETVAGIPYSWSVDGTEQARGVIDLPPGETELIFPWQWTFDRHEIALAIAPGADVQDRFTEDNRVAVHSDALSMAFYVDRSLYTTLLSSPYGSFELQIQRQVPYWNSVLADAVYPSTPNGALDRVRLDQVVVVPDGTPIPDDGYFYTDLFWKFGNGWSIDGRDQTILLHELLHQRGLVDLYAYEVAHYYSASDIDGRVNIVENGRAVAGTFLLPQKPDTRNIGGMFLFHTPVDGLMGFSYYRGSAKLTEVCANGLNLWHGRRSPVSRSPIGGGIVLGLKTVNADSYVHRLPVTTALSFVDDGKPISGGTVDVFLDQNPQAYRDTYSADPQLTLTMDADGAALLPGDVLTSQPPFRQPPKAQTMLLRVRTTSARAYLFVPVWEFNRLYFRNSGGPSALQLPVRMIPY